MKILMIGSLLTVNGGVQQYIRNLLLHMDLTRYPVDLLATPAPQGVASGREELEKAGVRILEMPDGGKARVSVENTGPTIDKDELPLLFDRFHKADKSRSADREGWGLGLYIAKTIVGAHGGDIWATSENGVTQFNFTLPTVR